MNTDTRAESKISILNETLYGVFGNKINKARIKFIGLFIMALSKVQTVSFEKLAVAFDHSVQHDSSLRRIQRFFASYLFDNDLVAKLIFNLLPHKPPYRLAMDRTNWKFGNANINILTLAIVYEGVAFPVLFKLLPKFGNSHTDERISLMDRYIQLFGKETIDCLLADREFIGKDWIDYLNGSQIRYHIRVRENFWVIIPRNKSRVRVTWLFNDLKINNTKSHPGIVLIKDQYCYLSGSLVKNKQGKPEYQIIISFNKPDQAQATYKERWQIETAFRALKSSGFNIEDTHLTKLDRIEKMLSLVLIAFAWTYRIGIFIDKIKPIKIKKHGRRAYSYFKYGLIELSKTLFSNNLDEFKNYCKFLSCT
jgi:hypothetical protein